LTIDEIRALRQRELDLVTGRRGGDGPHRKPRARGEGTQGDDGGGTTQMQALTVHQFSRLEVPLQGRLAYPKNSVGSGSEHELRVAPLTVCACGGSTSSSSYNHEPPPRPPTSRPAAPRSGWCSAPRPCAVHQRRTRARGPDLAEYQRRPLAHRHRLERSAGRTEPHAPQPRRGRPDPPAGATTRRTCCRTTSTPPRSSSWTSGWPPPGQTTKLLRPDHTTLGVRMAVTADGKLNATLVGAGFRSVGRFHTANQASRPPPPLA